MISANHEANDAFPTPGRRIARRLLPPAAAALTMLLAAAAPPTTPPVPPPSDTTAGRALAMCRVCHGDDLTGKKRVPPVAGLPRARVLKALGPGAPRPMAPILRRLPEADKATIAQYVSSLPKPDTKPGKPPPKRNGDTGSE